MAVSASGLVYKDFGLTQKDDCVSSNLTTCSIFSKALPMVMYAVFPTSLSLPLFCVIMPTLKRRTTSLRECRECRFRYIKMLISRW